jgi:hypothetical protein
MSQLDTPPGYQTASFRERGAAMPLTTPLLSGARVRLTDREGLELVVPKATGGRRNTLVAWDHIADLCALSVHDIRLLDRVGRLRIITPGTIRDASWLTLSEGFAGRRARAAAMAAMAADQEARVRTHYHLLLALVSHYEPAGRPIPPAKLPSMAAYAIERLAAHCHWRPESVADALTRLAPLLAPIGLGERIGTARIPSLLATLQAFRRSIDTLPIDTDWDAEAVALITRTTEIALACVTGALTEARALADNIPALIGAWMTDPAALTARLIRADWLTDGWISLCSYWTMAVDHDGQPPELADLVLLLPMIPDEVALWPGFAADTILPAHHARDRLPDEYSETNLIDALARNESLVALAV